MPTETTVAPAISIHSARPRVTSRLRGRLVSHWPPRSPRVVTASAPQKLRSNHSTARVRVSSFWTTRVPTQPTASPAAMPTASAPT